MIKKILSKNLTINFLIVLLIFLTDRFSKSYIIYLDQKKIVSEIFSSKFLNLQLIWNEGIAFGLFSFDETNLYNALTFIIFLIILLIFIMAIKNEGLKKYSLLMILGGALGNFYDRIFYRSVPDFIDFHIENFHWFIFNVADIFITIGVILMIILEFINNKKEKYENF